MRNVCRFLLRNNAAFIALVVCAAIFTACADPMALPTFTVSFNLNEGSGTAPTPQTVEAGSTITLPGGNGFLRTGFTFQGWSTNTDGTGTDFSAGAPYTPSGDRIMFARWELIGTFTVNFNANGGTGTVPELSANQGQGVTLPSGAGLVRAGQTFAGWNIRPDGTGANHDAGSTFVPPGNITLYARWVPTVVVSFNSNGGSGTVPAQAVGQGLSIMLPSGGELSKTGYSFGGWNTMPDGIGINHSAGSMFTPQGNITLYARWVAGVIFTLTFSANSGDGTVPTPRTVMAGSDITLPGGEELSRLGYVFAGWNENAAGTGINRSGGDSFTPTENMTLFARWIPGNSFTVTFHANGGIGAAPAPLTVNEGLAMTLPDGGGLSWPGFVFAGWNTNADGSGINREAGDMFTPTASITLFARWVTSFTVTFSANGGTGTVPTRAVAQGSGMILPGGEGLSRPGFSFAGWNTNAHGTGTDHDAGSIFMPPGNVTLYAMWVSSITVTFNANGGIGLVLPQTVEPGSSLILPSGDGLSRPGFVFVGWNTNADGTGINRDVGESFIPVGGITLFARWVLPALTGTVGITGTAYVGQTLTANTTNLGGSGDINFQWRRGNIDVGTNSSTYVVQAIDAGATITVTVTRANNSGSVTSTPTATVPLPPLTGTVNIIGTASVWQTLTANTDALGGIGDISFQWMRGDVPIDGANGNTYVVQSADMGLSIVVIVTRANNYGSVASAPTETVPMAVSVPGNNLAQQLAWLRDNAQKNGEYILEVRSDETIDPNNMLFEDRSNITITISGVGGMRTVSLSSNGFFFSVWSGVTLVLGGNVTLQGRNSNNSPLVQVNYGGTLVMNTGARIMGNSSWNNSWNSTGGVLISNGGTFRMYGGEISGNRAMSRNGGGVSNSGTFSMHGGMILGNTAEIFGGGVVNFQAGVFNMYGGEISGNRAMLSGGGVDNSGTFSMHGGSILGNTAENTGGGIFNNGTFSMHSGKISGNRAVLHDGGGVRTEGTGIFRISNGLIHGNNAPEELRNTARLNAALSIVSRDRKSVV